MKVFHTVSNSRFFGNVFTLRQAPLNAKMCARCIIMDFDCWEVFRTALLQKLAPWWKVTPF